MVALPLPWWRATTWTLRNWCGCWPVVETPTSGKPRPWSSRWRTTTTTHRDAIASVLIGVYSAAIHDRAGRPVLVAARCLRDPDRACTRCGATHHAARRGTRYGYHGTAYAQAM